MWPILRWVFAFTVLGLVSLGLYLGGYTNQSVVWVLMGVLAVMIVRLALLAISDDTPAPPVRPRPSNR